MLCLMSVSHASELRGQKTRPVLRNCNCNSLFALFPSFNTTYKRRR
jgi:hypothetical protein